LTGLAVTGMRLTCSLHCPPAITSHKPLRSLSEVTDNMDAARPGKAHARVAGRVAIGAAKLEF
jgi:hypothetical protein